MAVIKAVIPVKLASVYPLTTAMPRVLLALTLLSFTVTPVPARTRIPVPAGVKFSKPPSGLEKFTWLLL